LIYNNDLLKQNLNLNQQNMKHLHFSKMLFGKIYLKHCLMVIGIFCCFCTQAQTVKKKITSQTTTTSTPSKAIAVNKAPVIRTMAEYRKTPQYAKRKAELDKKNPSYVPYSKYIPYAKGPGLRVTLDRKPPTEQTSGIKTKNMAPEKKDTSGGYDCTSQQIKLTATSSTFMNNDYGPSVVNIYPGACYTYANLTDGNWQPQKGARNPLTINSNNPNINPNDSSYVCIQNPSISTIDNGIAYLFNGFRNVNASESQSTQAMESDNSATYNLQIGAGASGFGADISNTYQTADQSRTLYFTIDAQKSMFTLYATPPDSGFFKDPNVEATPYLSFISAVSYGCRIMGNATLTFNSSQEADKFKASYSMLIASAFLGVDFGSSSKSFTSAINCYIVGGPGNLPPSTTLQQLQANISNAFINTNSQNARPISYVADDMDGDEISTTSTTDEFTVKNCVPASAGAAEIESIAVNFGQGADGKEPGTSFAIGIFPGQRQTTTGADLPKAMFIYNSGGNSPRYNNNGNQTIILTSSFSGSAYKGKLDLEAFQKGGGTFYISPISAPSHDIWQINTISIQFNFKPTSTNPMGGNKTITYHFYGPNILSLDTNQPTPTQLYFDENFNIIGNGGQPTQ
jgi:hypothetical protein